MKFSRLLIPALVVAVLSSSMAPAFAFEKNSTPQTAHRVALCDRQASEIVGGWWFSEPPQDTRVFKVVFSSRNTVTIINSDKVGLLKVFTASSSYPYWKEDTLSNRREDIAYTAPSGWIIAKVGWGPGWIEQKNDKLDITAQNLIKASGH